MRNFFLFMFIVLFSSFVKSQSPIGVWKTIDDETGKAKSYVQIFEKNGVLYGKVSKILTKGKENSTCDKCKNELKGKPILGMVILSGLKKSGKEWTDGKIIDPNSGKEYKAKLTLNGENKLDLRGYVGLPLVGRTQTWERIQ